MRMRKRDYAELIDQQYAYANDVGGFGKLVAYPTQSHNHAMSLICRTLPLLLAFLGQCLLYVIAIDHHLHVLEDN